MEGKQIIIPPICGKLDKVVYAQGAVGAKREKGRQFNSGTSTRR